MAKAKWKIIKLNLLPAFLFILLIILTILTYQVIMIDKFYPQTIVSDTSISFLTSDQARQKLEEIFAKRTQQKLEFHSTQGTFIVDLATASANLDYSVLDDTFKTGRQGSLWDRAKQQFQTAIYQQKIYPKVTLSLNRQIDEIASIIDKAPQNAQLNFDETAQDASSSARIQIKESQDGFSLDKELLESRAKDFLAIGKYLPTLPTKVILPKITTEHVTRAKEALEASLTKPQRLRFEGNIFLIDTKQLLALLDLESGSELLLDKTKTYQYLANIAQIIDQPVQEGLFEFNPNTKRVAAFKPSQEGRKLDQDKTYQLLTDALTNRTTTIITLPVAIIKPKIQTSDVNSLGIKELIGRGTSYFAGSIQNRIYNINLAASRINGVLLSPGEIFSFNNMVGDISASSGYKQAYVIKSGRTVLDDGGGVCQDSTTLFRAVLNAGLPVVQRVAHAYRVGYYEQGFPPGLDATVFAPSVDFKFKNDTSYHILIQAYTAGNTLYVDLYGTSDGRNVVLSKPVVTDRVPAPEPLYQDDPTLPKGTVKQVDWAAQGADVLFIRTVSRGGEVIIKETWKSKYRPWQAVYLVGTQ